MTEHNTTSVPTEAAGLRAQALAGHIANTLACLHRWLRSGAGDEVEVQGSLLDSVPVDRFKQITFIHCYVAIAAKLIQSDGPLNTREYKAFLATIPGFSLHYDELGSLFLDAATDPAPIESYIRKIGLLFPEYVPLHHQLLCALLYVAVADGPLHKEETACFYKILQIFDLGVDTLETYLRLIFLPSSPNPYQMFKLSRRDKVASIKKAYKEFIKDCHPDILVSSDIDPLYRHLASEKFLLANQAYNLLLRKKRFSAWFA